MKGRRDDGGGSGEGKERAGGNKGGRWSGEGYGAVGDGGDVGDGWRRWRRLETVGHLAPPIDRPNIIQRYTILRE